MNSPPPDHLVLVKNTLLLLLLDLGVVGIFVMVMNEVIELRGSGKLRIRNKEYDVKHRPFATYSLLAMHVLSVLLMTFLATGFSLTILCKGYGLACGAWHGWQGAFSAYPEQ